MASGSEPSGAAPTSERIARELRWHAAGQIAGEIAWYGMVVVLAAVLEPRAFGIVAVGMVVVRAASLLTQAGTGGSLIAAGDLAREDVHAAIRQNLAIGLALTGLLLACSAPLAHAFADGGDADVLRILAVIVLLASLSSVPEALLKKSMQFKRFSLVTGTAALVTALCAIVAALLGGGVWALVVRQVLYQALLAGFAWAAARPVIAGLERRGRAARARRPATAVPFALVGASFLAAMTVDNLVVGAVTDTTQLGLYSLAFTLGFAPLTQLSWRIGQVLFPAAAATADLDVVGRRTVRVIRVTGLVLLPFIPVAVALAPAVLPGLFGDEWDGMVAPFQLLVLVGVLHALLNPIGEGLSGTRNIGFRAWSDTLWAVGTLTLVYVMASSDGIRGAALAHAIAFAPLALAYIFRATSLIGTSPLALWQGTRDIVVPVLGQALVTFAVLEALEDSGELAAGGGAALAGVATAALLMWRAPSRPLEEVRAVVALVVPRRAAAQAPAEV